MKTIEINSVVITSHPFKGNSDFLRLRILIVTGGAPVNLGEMFG